MKNIQKTCYCLGGKPKTFPPKGLEKNTELTADGCCTLWRMLQNAKAAFF